MRKCSHCGEKKPLNADTFRPIKGTPNFRHKCRKCEAKSTDLNRRGVLSGVSKAAQSAEKPAANEEPEFDLPIEVDASGVAPRYTDEIAALVKIAKGKPVAFEALCDGLDLSPAKTRDVIERAQKVGVHIVAEHGLVGVTMPEPDSRVREVDVAPTVGDTHRVAVISDTHLGSKYCLRAQLRDFVDYAYSKGVREILHPGDVLDGCYRHAEFEMSHMGMDEQASDLFDVLPQKPGLTYHAITGNHDFTFTEKTGVDVGHFLSNYFRERGRNDLRFYGNRGAFVRVHGAIVHLWHPRSGVSYARSYALQKHIEKYSSGEKPHVLLAGHWHVYCAVYERGVHAFACPTFQGGGSAFAKSLGGAPAIGGMILEWDLTASGTMRNLRHEFRAYFEREQPHRIDDRDSGIPVDKIA